jgi:hypothetical protein
MRHFTQLAKFVHSNSFVGAFGTEVKTIVQRPFLAEGQANRQAGRILP